MKYIVWGFFWASVYLLIVLMPLSILLIGEMPDGSGIIYDFSTFIGFAGTSMLAATFFLTARFKHAAMPFGIDLVYYFHRYVSCIVFLIVLLHTVLMAVNDPSLLSTLTSAYMLAGLGSLACLTFLIIFSVFRKKLNIHYDAWRIWHLILAISAVLLAVLHIEGVGGYIKTPVKQTVWALIIVSWLLLVVYVRLIKPLWLLKHPYKVLQIIKEKEDTWSLILVPDGHGGITFQPGQFVWLTLWNSPFSMKEHPFSISSSAENNNGIRLTIKELGDFTRTIKDVIPEQTVYVDGPYGSFSCDRHSSLGYIFIAGGIGIAPIMSMIKTLADRKDRRPLHLFYAYKNQENLTFYEEIEQVQSQIDLKVTYVLQTPPQNWRGEQGFLTADILKKHLPKNYKQFDYFNCGPVPMLRAIETTLHEFGVPLSSVHSELFDLV